MSTATLILLGAAPVALLLAVLTWRRRARLLAAGFATAAGGCGWALVTRATLVVLLGLVVAVVLLGLVVWHRRTRTVGTVTRWGNRSRRTSGVATTWDIARHGSARAMRRKATTVRPSLGELNRRQRARVRTTAVAVPLARVGALRVWASVEDVVTIFGGPRVGKTGMLCGIVLDAPGAVVTTSTRLDLMELTAPLRSRDGRPVYVFNPGGLGGVASTLRFDPLHGCADPVVAAERAADMIPETDGAGDRSYWEGQARRVLAALLHAAALGGRHMRDVLGWVADPGETAREVTSLLRRSPEPAFVHDFAQFAETNDRTRSSITSTVMPALSWLTSPAASAAISSAAGEAFDVAALLRERGTVYLLGRHEAHTAPLLAALTGYIAREARRLAAHQPGGRLDPPLSLALDEAARVAPVPLPDWSGDAGGSGITIVAAFQSRADLVDRWGPTGAAKVLNNSGAVLLFGGTKDPDDLEAWSRLAGDRDEPVETRNADGRVTSRTVRKVPVLTGSQLANLPPGRAVIFRRGMPVAIGTAQMAWRRRDVRAHGRASARARRETVAGIEWEAGGEPSPAGGSGR